MAVDEAGECSSRGLYEGEFFPGVPRIEYEGPDSMNPLAFHYYNADEVIMGKPMKDWWAFPLLLVAPCCCLGTLPAVAVLIWYMYAQAAFQRRVLAHTER